MSKNKQYFLRSGFAELKNTKNSKKEGQKNNCFRLKLVNYYSNFNNSD